MQRSQAEDTLREFFAKDPHGASAAYLFGSVARGTSRATSDVDIGVLLARPPTGFSGLNLDLEGSLESALGQRAQIVVMNKAPVDLIHRILRDARLVFEGDHRARVAFEVKARNEYFDLLAYLERYRAPRVDRELIAKRLAFIETCLRELRTNARLEVLETDLREQRYIEHTLQLAIQAALDVASHVVSDDRLGEPRTNRELFELLARHQALEVDLSKRLSSMAGFRNVLVHGYTDVDLGIVRDVVLNRLVDLDDFVNAVRGWPSPA